MTINAELQSAFCLARRDLSNSKTGKFGHFPSSFRNWRWPTIPIRVTTRRSMVSAGEVFPNRLSGPSTKTNGAHQEDNS